MSRFPEGVAAVAAAAAAAVLALTLALPAAAQSLGLGRVATPDEIAAWDIDVRPDGVGLPEGSGSVEEGEEIFVERCAICHGDFGEGAGRWPVLAGGQETLTDDRPVKTIGSYWPYLSTAWDYIHRAMPFGDAQSLEPDEVYAIVAYLLYLNDLVEDDFTLTRENFTSIRMPNEDGFIPDDRMESPVWKNREACMTDCKQEVRITARAAVVDVTPEDATARKAAEDAAARAAQEEEAAAEAEPAAVRTAAAAPDPALLARGEKAFKKCRACHKIGEGAKNAVGPQLNGLFGRVAGTAEGFSNYSRAMREAGENGLVWNDETLAEFLARPKAMIAKTRMSFAGFKKPEDIAAVIAWLRAAQP